MARRKTADEFIKDLKNIWGDTYAIPIDFTYYNSKTKIKLICAKHGEFWQYPSVLLNHIGCKQCSNEAKSKSMIQSNEDLYKKCIDSGNSFYDYSLILKNGKDGKDYNDIICPKHGVFKQNMYHHLKGEGCPKCALEKAHDMFVADVNDVVKRFDERHNGEYDYSIILKNPAFYKNMQTKLPIICHKMNKEGIEHGIFWQEPIVHLKGHGCPKCNETRSETVISDAAMKKHLLFIQQKRFPWMKRMSLDFYFPKYNAAIECQGIQHFQPINYFGGEDAFNSQIMRDRIKYDICKKHGIRIFYFSLLKPDKLPKEYIGKIYNDKDELLYEIKNKQ